MKEEIRGDEDTALRETQLAGEILLQWKSEPARKRPLVALTLFMCIGACGWAAAAFTGHFLLGLLAILILLGAFSGTLFPSRYKLTAEEIWAKTPFGVERKRIKNYRRVVRERRGALLSPFSRKHRLDTIRGYYIRKEENPEELWEILEKLLDKASKQDDQKDERIH